MCASRPVCQQIVNHSVAHGVGGFERGQVSAVGSDALVGQALGGGHAAWLLVVVAHRAQDEDALPVDAAGLREEFERLEGAGVLHRRGGELAFPAGEVANPLRGPGVGEFAVPVGGGRDFVAEGDEGRTLGSGAVKAGADFLEARWSRRAVSNG